MNHRRILAPVIMLLFAVALGAEGQIINHHHTDFTRIPTEYLNAARATLRIVHGHASHGTQLAVGTQALAASNSKFAFASNMYRENIGDNVTIGVPNLYTWESLTRGVLNNPSNDRNVVIWSWCGELTEITEADVNVYLNQMDALERDYPSVKFVYMTAHLDGLGENGPTNPRNNQIRAFCAARGKTLFDFGDIESYDPDGQKNYMKFYADDNCDYTDSLRNHYAGNWAQQWIANHPNSTLATIAGTICQSCCAHSQGLNCVLKAGAFWWMLARLAGWDGSTTLATASTTENDVPNRFVLNQNFPNPFNPSTRITYTVGANSGPQSAASTVRLAVYDLLGREVAVLVNKETQPGSYEVNWDASGFSSGLYVYRLTAGGYSESRKMMLTR
jgi:hypothetical protein